MKKLFAGIFSAVIALALVAVVAQVSAKGGCDVTVTTGGSATAIQDAVNAASTGDKICLDGTFTTTSGSGGTSQVDTVTVGISHITIKSASPGVMVAGDGPAFRLADGLSNVTIEGLEIRDRTGLRGGGIEAWDVSTSNITIRLNHIHDNTYSGVLVGSEGGFIHNNWRVRDNDVYNHGFVGIELTNCENCQIMKNNVNVPGDTTSTFGIVVQARNTITDGALVHINAVKVLHNTIGDAVIGMYVIAYEGQTGGPFNSVGASSRLTSVTINNNTVGSSLEGIRFWGFNDGAGGAGGGSGGTAENSQINHNNITCSAAGIGVNVLVSSGPGNGDGTVVNVKTMNNTIAGCGTDVINPT